ncbi:MAG TPA: glycogen-binding domain-containing protein [Clostridia bacterium]|nr:glycogen-binding domain-containing protein [Clostridia bacterium]
MFSSINNLFIKKSHKGGPIVPEPSPGSMGRDTSRQQTYSKVFRWRLPVGQTDPPNSVEVVGSFTHWQKVPLQRDSVLDAWHVTLHSIPGNRTHHYMMLVNGEPFYDKTCDGLAVPHGPDEERFQIRTDKGPRVFMLFAQTK